MALHALPPLVYVIERRDRCVLVVQDCPLHARPPRAANREPVDRFLATSGPIDDVVGQLVSGPPAPVALRRASSLFPGGFQTGTLLFAGAGIAATADASAAATSRSQAAAQDGNGEDEPASTGGGTCPQYDACGMNRPFQIMHD